MGLNPRFDQRVIRSQLQSGVLLIERAIINRLCFLGEQCVNKAREEGKYLNQTGNLRNSIGYVVYANGSLVYHYFEKVVDGNMKSEVDPIKEGRNYAEEIGGKIAGPDDFVLIVVAGMEYASVVESKGLNVITTAEQFAEKKFPEMMRELKLNIKSLLK